MSSAESTPSLPLDACPANNACIVTGFPEFPCNSEENLPHLPPVEQICPRALREKNAQTESKVQHKWRTIEHALRTGENFPLEVLPNEIDANSKYLDAMSWAQLPAFEARRQGGLDANAIKAVHRRLGVVLTMPLDPRERFEAGVISLLARQHSTTHFAYTSSYRERHALTAPREQPADWHACYQLRDGVKIPINPIYRPGRKDRGRRYDPSIVILHSNDIAAIPELSGPDWLERLTGLLAMEANSETLPDYDRAILNKASAVVNKQIAQHGINSAPQYPAFKYEAPELCYPLALAEDIDHRLLESLNTRSSKGVIWKQFEYALCQRSKPDLVNTGKRLGPIVMATMPAFLDRISLGEVTTVSATYVYQALAKVAKRSPLPHPSKIGAWAESTSFLLFACLAQDDPRQLLFPSSAREARNFRSAQGIRYNHDGYRFWDGQKLPLEIKYRKISRQAAHKKHYHPGIKKFYLSNIVLAAATTPLERQQAREEGSEDKLRLELSRRLRRSLVARALGEPINAADNSFLSKVVGITQEIANSQVQA